MTGVVTWGLYDRSDLDTPLSPMASATDVKFSAESNRPGFGEIALQNTDPTLALLTDSSVVRYFIDGTPVFSHLVRLEDRRSIDEGEEARQRTKLSGAGLLAILEEAVVYPTRGVGRLPIEEERAFSWASPYYVAASATWDPATEIAAVNGGAWWGGMPIDWPESGISDDPTMWIWNADGNNDWAPAATSWFRHNFTVASGVGAIEIYMGVDNEGELYFDGQKILTGGSSPPTDMFHTALQVNPGTHTVAAKVKNLDEPAPVDLSGNPAGLLVAAFASDQATIDYGFAIEHTNSDWIVTRDEPGMTPGQIVLLAIEEAQTRGCFADIEITYTFDEELDSSGAAWPLVNRATRVGNDLLSFFAELEDCLVLKMAPDSFELSAWTPDTYGEPQDATFHAPTDPTDPETGNLRGLTHRRAT